MVRAQSQWPVTCALHTELTGAGMDNFTKWYSTDHRYNLQYLVARLPSSVHGISLWLKIHSTG